jgi:hypothetical protein
MDASRRAPGLLPKCLGARWGFAAAKEPHLKDVATEVSMTNLLDTSTTSIGDARTRGKAGVGAEKAK